jgi:dTDP-4-amino-4,6-dideoxygalactose transaminase
MKITNDKMNFLSHQDGWTPPEGLPANAAWPYFAEDEVQAAAAVLRSGKVNQWTGEEVERFQEEFAASCGVKHAIALANGSVALELALSTLGIGPGDEVIVTPRTFIASASCAVLQGAIPVFADVDCESQNITAEPIRKVLSPKTKAIIVVHLAGWPCDMDAIMDLARQHNLKVIEDCAQAHGARYKGKPVGSFGHVAAFSFCQDKIMTTGGEGGMLLTDDDAVWSSSWAFKDHGKSYESVHHKKHPNGFRWLHDSFGTNWRLTEMQAAIGRVQLRKLEKWVEIRRRNAAILTERFSKLEALRLTIPPPEIFHSYYKYYAFVRPERLKAGWDRDRIMNKIVAEGIPCFSGSCSEIYLEKAFTDSDFRQKERLPVARELGETSLMFLVHPTLSEEGMHVTADAVERALAEATQ